MLNHMHWENMELARNSDVIIDEEMMMDRLVGSSPEVVNNSVTSSRKHMEKAATDVAMDAMATAKEKVRAVKARAVRTAIIIIILMGTAAILVGIIRALDQHATSRSGTSMLAKDVALIAGNMDI